VKVFLHPEYGEIKFQKILLEIEKPVLFIASFEKNDEKYVGLLVEEYGLPFTTGKMFKYYFVGVADNEIRHLEKTKGALKDIFENRPVMYLQHKDVMGNMTDHWENQKRINHLYEITERASLSC
jgi:hypothetical protein